MLSDYQRYRIYEMLPGLSIWVSLVAGVVFSFVFPLSVIYVILVFDVYWVLRVLYFCFYLLVSWRRFRRAIRVDWMQKLMVDFPEWGRRRQVVFLPVYNESFTVVCSTLDAIARSSYPVNQLYVVLSGEARQAAHWQALQQQITEKYSGIFAELIFYTHPAGLAGEIPGKGSNIHFAEEQFRVYVDQQGWAYRDVVVSIFDIDTVVHPHYFAHLLYMYCAHPHPERSSFQPVTLYHNNIWESGPVLRIMAYSTTFWMLFSLARLDNLVTFSSHSMSFQAIVDCGGHAKDIVSEDSRIFFQCWLRYNGDYEVTPLYIPVSMDTVHDNVWWKALKNLYYQQRRWAWGAENIPYLLWQFHSRSGLPWFKKWLLLWREWEGKWSWAVVAILLTILGRLPLWVAGEDVRQSALFFNTPFVLERLMTLSLLGLLLSVIMTVLVLPPLPEKQPPHRYLFMIAQWALLPVSLVLFSAIPCIEAVTHLMLGHYLGFNVSKKRG